jgi:hypothetical protein
LLVTTGAGAQILDSSVKIVYFHADNHAEVQKVNGTFVQAADLNTEKKLEVRSPQTVRIEIADPNPVFFKYTKGQTTFTPNPNYKAALDFAKAIKALPSAIGLQAGTPEDRFEKAVRRIAELIDMMPDIARQTLAGKELVKAAQDTVRNWNLSGLETDLSSLETAGQNTTARTDSTPNILNGVTATGFQNPSAPAPPPPTPSTPVPSTPNPTLQDALNQVTNLRNELNAEKARQATAKIAAEAKTHLATLKQFQAAVLTVNDPISLAPEAVDIDQNPTVHLNIERLPAFPDINTAPRKVGDIAIPLQAYSPVNLSFGPAVVYSFVKAPVFSAAKQADGTLKIAEKRENRAQNISAMLTITPRPWSDETFGGAFQLGVNPVKNQIGLFTGLELRISRLIRLGGGYAFQQVPKLDGALSVGGTIASEDALKTSTHFKSGAYVSMTLSLPKEKE